MKTHGNLWESKENYKIDTPKFNLLPNERLESFWDALWLGIRTFLCFKMSNWSHFGIDLGHLGVTLGDLEATWGHFGVTLGHLGATLRQLRAPLGYLGATLGHLWVTWEPLGSHLGTLGSHFGAFWRHFKVSLG